MIRGCYLFSSKEVSKSADKLPITHQKTAFDAAHSAAVTLLGSGAIMTEVVKAAEMLTAQGIKVHVVSVTSWSELARDGLALENDPENLPWIERVLNLTEGPIVAATDYVRAVPEQIRAYLPPGREYKTLGTDGFGRSDQRAVLRAYFEVDAASVVKAALAMLA